MNRPIDVHSSERQAQPSPVPRELELIDYLAAILRHRRLVVALALAFGLLGALVSLVPPRQFAATTLIAVTPPRLEAASGRDEPSTLIPVLQADAIVARMVADLGLDRPPFSLSPRRFVRDHLTAESLPGTSFLEVTVTLPDGELARRAADELSSRAVDRFRAMGDEEGSGMQAQIHQLVGQAEQRYEAAGRTLQEYRTSAQIELLRKDVEARLGQRSEFLALQVKLDAERGRLERAERELAVRPDLSTTTDTIVRNPVLAEAARAQSGEASVLGLKVQSEHVNEAKRQIDVEVATIRATVTALERQRDRMIQLGQVNVAALPLLSELYVREAKLARYQLDYEVASKAFEDASGTALNARIRTSTRLPYAQIVEHSTLPAAPESRAVARNTAIGVVAGAAVGCLIALGRLALGRIDLLPGATRAAARPDGPPDES